MTITSLKIARVTFQQVTRADIKFLSTPYTSKSHYMAHHQEAPELMVVLRQIGDAEMKALSKKLRPLVEEAKREGCVLMHVYARTDDQAKKLMRPGYRWEARLQQVSSR